MASSCEELRRLLGRLCALSKQPKNNTISLYNRERQAVSCKVIARASSFSWEVSLNFSQEKATLGSQGRSLQDVCRAPAGHLHPRGPGAQPPARPQPGSQAPGDPRAPGLPRAGGGPRDRILPWAGGSPSAPVLARARPHSPLLPGRVPNQCPLLPLRGPRVSIGIFLLLQLYLVHEGPDSLYRAAPLRQGRSSRLLRNISR